MEDGRNISVRNALNHSYTGLIDRDNDRMFPEGVYSIYMRLEVCNLLITSFDIDV